MYLKSVCVFCASSTECDELYLHEAAKLGQSLARAGFRIIYGGGKVGLMGVLADGALNEGGKVTGIVPEILSELSHDGISELRVVTNLAERKSFMLYQSDYIVALPGGIGTLDEILEAISWKLLGIIDSPLYIINLNNYFNPFIDTLNKTITEKFMDERYRKLWKVVTSVEEFLFEINNSLPLNPITSNLA
jgi:uncharacterized protein (TIGR00730 family)